MSSGARTPAGGRWLIAAGAALWLSAAPAQIVRDAVPGGLVEIPLTPAERPQPAAYFGQDRSLVTRLGKRWVSLVGLPLDLAPGTYVMQVRIEDGEESFTRNFTVYPRRRDQQQVLRLAQMPFDEPEVTLEWRDSLDTALPLAPPVAVPARAVFGRSRQISETRSGYVDFVTFRTDSGMPVRAPGGGRVAGVDTDESGAYLWIDHGMGLFTCVGPLTQLRLEPEDTVDAGATIGTPAPEADQPVTLYWQVYLNGSAINPLLISNTPRATDEDLDPGEQTG